MNTTERDVGTGQRETVYPQNGADETGDADGETNVSNNLSVLAASENPHQHKRELQQVATARMQDIRMPLSSQIMEDLRNQLGSYNQSQGFQNYDFQSWNSVPRPQLVLPSGSSVLKVGLEKSALWAYDAEDRILSLDLRTGMTALGPIASSGFDARAAFAPRLQPALDASLGSNGFNRLLQVRCIYPPA